ncbi:hypothetical protein ACB092_05G084000 [Castanea dentata]
MASVGEEELKYESNPEEMKRLLAVRRKEASDDEETEEDGREKTRVNPWAVIHSNESDGQGGVVEYDHDEEELDEEELLEEEELWKGKMKDLLRKKRRGLEDEEEEVEEKKVPTVKAFYMHDDRFTDNAGGRPRYPLFIILGHDKFEEMNLQEKHYDKNSKGHYRGCGNRSKAFKNNNQIQAPKGVRGRGPRRYEPAYRNRSQAPQTENRHTSYTNSARAFSSTSNVESDPVPKRRQVFSSSNSGSSYRDLHPTVMDDGSSVQQTNSLLQGKNIVESVGMDNLYIDDSINTGAGKPLSNMQMPLFGSSLVNPTQSLPLMAQGRGFSILGQMNYQQGPSHNQVNRVSSSTQLHSVQKGPVQSRALSINSNESGEAESTSESNKYKGALVGKGKTNTQGTGRGSFMYGGVQVMGATGNMAVGHGDQNFPGTPAFLPVMRFGGQHPGGVGVPAVGMAFPGYVAQPQLGLGNSEMTWLAVLADAAGALGVTYCSPYIVDSAYYARPSGQTSSVGASSKENNLNKPNNEWKPSQRPELASDEFGQRQNKPCRYS